MVIQHLLLTRCGATTRSLCFVVMSCLTVPIWAQEVNSGFVDFISKGGSFLLKENGTGNGRPLKISTPVKSGDVIDVVPQTGKTTGNSFVRLLWGESFIEVKRFPYPIQTTQSGSNFFVKILLILTGHYKPVEAGSVTRGDCNPNSELKLSIPMLTEENILREGSRELYVGWYGGKSPYAVKVFRLNQKNLLW
ncbi:MAG: hypothetical protein BWK78_09810 [Thiotrichaceae bacterium IS1]|nr:MAG: hypothetical protein BWK78_09810 [Thiotrichaceae bacterium IS1]